MGSLDLSGKSFFNQPIERQGPRPKGQDQDRGQHEKKRVRADKFVRVGENTFDSIDLRCEIGDDGDKYKRKGDEPGTQPGQKQQSSKAFRSAGKVNIEGGEGDVQALKELSHLAGIH